MERRRAALVEPADADRVARHAVARARGRDRRLDPRDGVLERGDVLEPSRHGGEQRGAAPPGP